jgi:hypothetical protein
LFFLSRAEVGGRNAIVNFCNGVDRTHNGTPNSGSACRDQVLNRILQKFHVIGGWLNQFGKPGKRDNAHLSVRKLRADEGLGSIFSSLQPIRRDVIRAHAPRNIDG